MVSDVLVLMFYRAHIAARSSGQDQAPFMGCPGQEQKDPCRSPFTSHLDRRQHCSLHKPFPFFGSRGAPKSQDQTIHKIRKHPWSNHGCSCAVCFLYHPTRSKGILAQTRVDLAICPHCVSLNGGENKNSPGSAFTRFAW